MSRDGTVPELAASVPWIVASIRKCGLFGVEAAHVARTRGKLSVKTVV